MTIVQCPNCGASYRRSPQLKRTTYPCAQCGTVFSLSADSTPAADATPPPPTQTSPPTPPPPDAASEAEAAPPARRGRRLVIGGAAGVLSLGLAALGYVSWGGTGEEPVAEAPAPVADQPATPPPAENGAARWTPPVASAVNLSGPFLGPPETYAKLREAERSGAAERSRPGPEPPIPSPRLVPGDATSPGDARVANMRERIERNATAVLFMAHPAAELKWFRPAGTVAADANGGFRLTYHFGYEAVARPRTNDRTRTNELILTFEFDRNELKRIRPELSTELLLDPPFTANSPALELVRAKLAGHVTKNPPSSPGVNAGLRDQVARSSLGSEETLRLLLNVDDPELFQIVGFGVYAVAKVDRTTPAVTYPAANVDYRDPFTAALSFVNAIRAGNPELLARSLSIRVGTRAGLKSTTGGTSAEAGRRQELLQAALNEELPESWLGAFRAWIGDFVMRRANAAKSSGERGVIFDNPKRINNNFTVYTKAEADGWKVYDLSEIRGLFQLQPRFEPDPPSTRKSGSPTPGVRNRPRR